MAASVSCYVSAQRLRGKALIRCLIWILPRARFGEESPDISEEEILFFLEALWDDGKCFAQLIGPGQKQGRPVHVCVCVFLYVLHIDYQSVHSTGKLRPFLGSEELMAGLAGINVKGIFRVKTWLRNVIRL